MQYPDNGCGELIETLLRLLKAFLSNNVCASSWSNLGPKVLTISGRCQEKDKLVLFAVVKKID